jgi:hypothetical protein
MAHGLESAWYKIRQENERRGENKVHSLSPFLLFVSGR